MSTTRPTTPLEWAEILGHDLSRWIRRDFPRLTTLYGNPFVNADTQLIPAPGEECEGPELQIDLGDIYRAGQLWPQQLLDSDNLERSGRPSDVAELTVSLWTCIPPTVDDDRSRPERGESVKEVAQLGWLLATGINTLAYDYAGRGDRGTVAVGRVTGVKDARAGWSVLVKVPVCLTCDDGE